jgi:hypothetical protein
MSRDIQMHNCTIGTLGANQGVMVVALDRSKPIRGRAPPAAPPAVVDVTLAPDSAPLTLTGTAAGTDTAVTRTAKRSLRLVIDGDEAGAVLLDMREPVTLVAPAGVVVQALHVAHDLHVRGNLDASRVTVGHALRVDGNVHASHVTAGHSISVGGKLQATDVRAAQVISARSTSAAVVHGSVVYQ